MTAARGPGPEPRQPPDPLPDLLELASREGALEGEGLASFLEALRARAGLVVAERTERLEERIRGLEAETESLSHELGKASEAHDALLKEADNLSRELRKASEAHDALLKTAEKLSQDLGRASEAHDALLAHQRQLVEGVATQLVSIASLSPLRARQARRRLLALAELLRVDSR